MKHIFAHNKRLKTRFSILLVVLFSFTILCCNNVSENNSDKNKNGIFSDAVEKNTPTASAKSNSFTSAKFTTDNMLDAATVEATLMGNSRRLPLYGFNGNITKSVPWTNKAFRDSVASLGLRVIRYPGGTVSNYWNWRKGDFTADDSKFKKPAAFQNDNSVPNTLDDLKLLINEAHCDVVFTLNMITSTLEDQLAMLDRAQSLGIPVKWIELGNEFNIRESVGKDKFASPVDYAKTAISWIGAIKNKFPNAKIAAVAGNRNYSANVKDWNAAVLANSKPDAVVAHLYPLPGAILDNNGINFQKLYNEFNKRFNSQGFNLIKDKINIWVTEYNIHWAAGEAGEKASNIQNAFTWSQTLAILLMTSQCTSFSNNVQLIVNHNIANAASFAAIETANKTFRKLPSGIGMELWLKASSGMTDIQKIGLTNNGAKLNDYEAVGWKFFSGNNASYLFINFTGSPLKVDVGNMVNKDLTCIVRHANKNAAIKSENDIAAEKQNINSGSLTLPPFSVASIR